MKIGLKVEAKTNKEINSRTDEEPGVQCSEAESQEILGNSNPSKPDEEFDVQIQNIETQGSNSESSSTHAITSVSVPESTSRKRNNQIPIDEYFEEINSYSR